MSKDTFPKRHPVLTAFLMFTALSLAAGALLYVVAPSGEQSVSKPKSTAVPADVSADLRLFARAQRFTTMWNQAAAPWVSDLQSDPDAFVRHARRYVRRLNKANYGIQSTLALMSSTQLAPTGKRITRSYARMFAAVRDLTNAVLSGDLDGTARASKRFDRAAAQKRRLGLKLVDDFRDAMGPEAFERELARAQERVLDATP